MRAKLHLLIIQLLLPFILLAQEYPTFNHRFYLDFPATIFTGLEVTDSCYYVSGVVADSLPPYNVGALFTKFDLEGNPLMIRTYLDSLKSFGTWEKLVATPDGGFVVAGHGKGHPTYSAFLLKYNENGDTTIFKAFPNPPNLYIRGVGVAFQMVEEQIRYYLLTEEVEDNTLNDSDIVIRALDQNGNVLWNRRFESNSYNEVPNLIIVDSEKIIIGGSKNNTIIVDQDHDFQDNIIGLNHNGEKLWEFLTPLTDYRLSATAITLANNNSGIIVCSGRGEDEYVNAGRDVPRWFSSIIYKLDNDQQVVWETEFTEPYPTLGGLAGFNKIITLADSSGYVAAGRMLKAYTETTGDYMGWLVKVSPEGDSLWRRLLRYFPANNLDYEHIFYDLEETPDDGFLLAGVADDNYAEQQRQQGWLMKVDEYGCLIPGCQLVSTQEQASISALSLHLYPNPATDFINVLLNDEQIAQRHDARLQLLDGQGRVLRSYPAGQINEVTNMLSVEGLPGGAYIIQYVVDRQVLVAEQCVVTGH